MIDENIIEVERKNAHGTDFFYPRNPTAENAAALWEQKTLTVRNMGKLKKLGFVIMEVVTAQGKKLEVGAL